MKGRQIKYTLAELDWLKRNKYLRRSAAHAQFCEKFGRTDVTKDNIKSLYSRKGWKSGRIGCFPKGNVPANKGKKMPFNANSAKTQFKKGERRGVAVKLYKPIGSERVTKDGYIERKIHDGMPLQSRWRAVHIIHWEETNGAMPDGHVLKCLDADKANTDLSNWELVSRAMLPRLNGKYGRNYDAADPQVKPTIMATAKLLQTAHDLKQNGKRKNS